MHIVLEKVSRKKYLEHSAKGTEWKDHKYVEKVQKNGKTYYVYNRESGSRADQDAVNTVDKLSKDAATSTATRSEVSKAINEKIRQIDALYKKENSAYNKYGDSDKYQSVLSDVQSEINKIQEELKDLYKKESELVGKELKDTRRAQQASYTFKRQGRL